MDPNSTNQNQGSDQVTDQNAGTPPDQPYSGGEPAPETPVETPPQEPGQGEPAGVPSEPPVEPGTGEDQPTGAPAV